MVTVQERVGREEVHNGIVFTLGPGHLPRRTWRRGRRRWPGSGSRLAAPPSLAPPLNRTNNAAGRPRLLQWTLTWCGQKDTIHNKVFMWLVNVHCGWRRLSRTRRCWLTSALVLCALPPRSSCSPSSVWLFHCLTFRSAPPLSLQGEQQSRQERRETAAATQTTCNRE